MSTLAVSPVRAWPEARLHTQVGILTAGFAALVFIPYLGAVGLWDPWETHYSEVGRSMLERGDGIHPFWENSWFFSKPPLTPWLAAFGLWAVGGGAGAGELPQYAEWAIRLPFALLAIAAVGLLSHAVSKLGSRPAGLACGVALSTMPLFFFTARQAMTDMPFVACITIAWACALLGQHGGTGGRWWYGFYAAMGVATLGKGLLGGLPAVSWLLWWALTRPTALRAQVREMKLARGALLFAVIALPWYLAMIAFDGRDAEGLLFWQRFFVHDHLNRLVSGVFTTTPGGTFTYFVEQGGYAMFPWVALLPGAIAEAVRVRLDDPSTKARLTVWAVVWAGFTFALFSSSATKFHHYVLPVLPGLAVLIGLFVARVLEEGVRPHVLALIIGLVIFGLIGKDLVEQPRHFLDLFTYNYERPYPEFLVTPMLKNVLGGAFALAAVLGVLAVWRKSGRGLVGVTGALALGLALWLSWSHWVSMSHHWTQRDLFWRYWQQRAGDEPIAAFMMDWKGETFYSRNTVVQLKPNNVATELPRYLARPGRKWMLTEHARINVLRNAIPPEHPVLMIEPSLNNKFVLLRVD